MSDVPCFMLANFRIHDADTYRKYEKGFFPVLKPHGGRFVTYDDSVTVLEGERAEGRTVIIEFDDEATLMRWWNSDAYRELAKIRHASVTTHSLSVVHPRPASGS